MSEIVITGGGVAAASVAQTLRAEGYDGEIHLYAEEPHSPYQRPPLSKGYLSGTEGADAVILHSDDWYAEHDIEVYPHTHIISIDREAHAAVLFGGNAARYDQLVLATGSSPRPLGIPGADLPGVHTLRRLADADALGPLLRAGGHNVVVIGGGWIGMEVAAVARAHGNEVTVLCRGSAPLASALGGEMGRVFQRLHEDHGTRVVTGIAADHIEGEGQVSAVLAGGERFPADLVIAGVGALPNTALAEAAGIETDHGILTDASFRTSDPAVFAVGDVANPMHATLGRRLRSEHWAFALDSGRTAARAMLGQPAVFDWLPFFFSDQFDLGMELSGVAPLMTGAEIVTRGDVEGREFIAFWLQGGAVVGGMNVNVWDVNEQVQALIRAGGPVDRAVLADLNVPLGSLVAA